MMTSEYAMGTIAAVAFAVLLYKVVTSGQVKAALQGIVKRALECADVNGARDRGFVTAEAAVVLSVLVAFAMALVWGLLAAAAQIQCVDAARAGARAAARQEPDDAVRAAGPRGGAGRGDGRRGAGGRAGCA